jgi:hypothetical protein
VAAQYHASSMIRNSCDSQIDMTNSADSMAHLVELSVQETGSMPFGFLTFLLFESAASAPSNAACLRIIAPLLHYSY